jgi:hypothetical protein
MKEPSVDQDSQTQPTPVPTTPVTSSGTPQPSPAWTPGPAPMPAAAPAAAAPVRKGPSARVLNTVLAGALVLAVAGIAFAAGRMTAPASAVTARGTFPGGGQGLNGYFGGRQGGQGGAFGGGAFAAGGAGGGVTIQGTVDAVSATTLTLKLASGQTIQIALDPTTTYHSQTNASASDIVSGGTVQVQLNLGRGAGGAGGEDGSVTGPTARDITVVP